ncbi:MAG TPA: IS701 family transposase [Gemmatimonadaceae bacterium]|nr:IS701 family transposase [Gemmatimonadaceae bacterium]
MDRRELKRVSQRLEVFTSELFDSFVRREQLSWGRKYLGGLMLDGRRKSIQPMAERLGEHDHQGLSQFVNQSTWAVEPVREALAVRMFAELDPELLVIDDVGFPKQGRDSVGVARMYSGALGKVGNCQIGVSLTIATDTASCPVNWRLFLPESWDADTERRTKCGVPAEVRHVPKWQLALDQIDDLIEWGLEVPTVAADTAYGDVTDFRLALEQRGLSYVVQVKPTTTARALDEVPRSAEYGGRGQPPKAQYELPLSSLAELAANADPDAWERLTYRTTAADRELTSRFLVMQIRPANRKIPRTELRELPPAVMVCEWPSGDENPARYWLSNLPADTAPESLARLAKLRWRIEQDYRELKHGLGLDHFEGRSWRGWQHHVTLASVAHAFLTIERRDPKVPAPA